MDLITDSESIILFLAISITPVMNFTRKYQSVDFAIKTEL